jgi:4-hydroxy-tetrahydrodipicolinate synthase
MAFGGVRPVLHVPFDSADDQRIVHAELASLVEHVVRARVHGVVVLGLASEAWTLRESERDEVLATVATALSGRLPMVVGIDGPTPVAVARARRARAHGATGLMTLPPPRARTTAQLVAHFSGVADATGLPILVQDSPQVTGVPLPLDTLFALRDGNSLVAAVKVEIGGAGAKVSACAGAGMEVVAGWGGQHYLETVRRGAVGVMPGCDLAPALQAIDAAARRGDDDGAEALYRMILPYLAYEAQSLELLVLGAKRHLARRGIFASARMRAPARELDEEEARTLDALAGRLAADGAPGFAEVAP